MREIKLFDLVELTDRKPAYALVENVDLVVVRHDDNISVLYGRCPHRGALLSDGCVEGKNLICGLHRWDFRYDTGISEYNHEESLMKFTAWIEDEQVFVDGDEIAGWEREHPQNYNRDQYLGLYVDHEGTRFEPHVDTIQGFAKNGIKGHGPTAAMGVPMEELPLWDDIQIVTAQLSRLPQLDEVNVDTKVIIGPSSNKPLTLEIPIFVSDMSFGALSEEAKIALSKGAQIAGTGICSGEGGMLPEEQENNARYFYELASGRFGYSIDKVKQCQAFHFKGGQGAKTGTGGHLPGEKVVGKIAEVRGLGEGTPAISPARFPDWNHLSQIKEFSQYIKGETGGIPVGYKLSAQHIEEDLDAAIEVGVDYVILDGRGGGTGAAPTIFRDHISVPTIPALARARKHLDRRKNPMSLVITGGLRTASDFTKALALGADAIAISNSALQAIGCLGMRACHTNNCPVGIATQKEHLRKRLNIDISAQNLARFLESSVHLMKTLARACGHTRLADLCLDDITTWKKEMADLAGIPFGGVSTK